MRRNGGWTLLAWVAVGCGSADSGGVATYVVDWRDEVIYQALVDRFDNGDPDNDWLEGIGPVPGDLARHQGGDWQGLRRRLDYIKSVGATAVWISPIVRNLDRTDYQDGYHGYWAADFTAVNPRFGSLDDLRDLVDAAHRRGMKIIVDVVTNHTGRLFFYDFDGDGVPDRGELEPEFSLGGPHRAPIRWLTAAPALFTSERAPLSLDEPVRRILTEHDFHRRGQTSDHSDPVQKELGDFPTGLRDLDTENPEIVDALIATYAHWVELTDVDGFRLDAVPHVPRRFWRDFNTGLRERLAAIGKEQFLLVGEVFTPDAEVLADYTREGAFDSVFDFTLKQVVIDGVILDGNPAGSAVAALVDPRPLYPAEGPAGGLGLTPWQARVGFADNHDVVRLRGWLDDPFAAELAMTVLFTVDAIPCIYYGTEQEFAGRADNESREVLWETGFDRTTRMARHLAQLAAIRRGSLALRRGELVVRYASEISGHDRGPGAGLLAWERVAGAERALVAINGHPLDVAQAQVDTGFVAGTVLRDALGEPARRWVVDSAGAIELDVAPREARILLP
jgi:alpha-amylase